MVENEKRKYRIKKGIKDMLTRLVSPIEKLLIKRNNTKYNKKVERLEAMTSEEFISKYAKTLMKDLIKGQDFGEDDVEFYSLNKPIRVSSPYYDRLSWYNLEHYIKNISYKHKEIRDFYLYNKEFREKTVYGADEDYHVEYINHLLRLLAKEATKLGLTTEIVDTCEEVRTAEGDTYRGVVKESYLGMLARVGYEYTLKITL